MREVKIAGSNEASSKGGGRAPQLAENYDLGIPKKNQAETPAEKSFKREENSRNTNEIKTNQSEEILEIADIGDRKGAVYEKYYLDVRNKIKSTVEKNKRGLFKESEIYVRFTLDRTGALKDISLYKAGGSEFAELERLAIKSIKEAAPFQSFDDKIKEDELQFNLPIRVIRKN